MTIRTDTDSFLRLTGCFEDGDTLVWAAEVATVQPSMIYDVSGDGALDAGADYFASPSIVFSGYYLSAGGFSFGVFENAFTPTVCYIPYDSSILDLATILPITDRVATPLNPQDNTTVFCFVTGTRIATPDGDRPVERLEPGDLVRTADGRAVPVRWIGRQWIPPQAANMGLPETRLPVRIEAGVLGAHCALTLSADHGLYLDGLVINAGALVNGTSIRFATEVDIGADPSAGFTYWHVETEAHDAILAEGLPAETFIDAAGRQAFDNYPDYLTRFGTDRIIPECRLPRIATARLLPDSLRMRLGIDERWVA